MINVAAFSAWTDVFVEERFLSNALWQWAGLFGMLLVSLAVGKVVSFVLLRQASRMERREASLVVVVFVRSLARPASLLVLAGGLYAAGTFMTFDESAARFWLNVCQTIAVLAGGWFLYRMVDILEHYLKRWTSRTQTTLDDQLVPLIRKALRVFVVIVLALFVAQNIFQWNIGALLAGLGIGGLAVAMAAREMIANFFGSIMIFADRPFQMGDWVRIGEHEGIIEKVGFRSTRIRTFYGQLVTIPNANVASGSIDNVSRRAFIRRNLDVTVTYDTPPQKMQRAMDIVREMLDARKDHFPPDQPGKVYFSDFNAASLNILVIYWYTPPDWWQYLAFNNEFNMELLRRFNEEGIEFAFPTQTLYLKQDSAFQADVRLGGGGQEGQA
jgi:MscS family membrane protein